MLYVRREKLIDVIRTLIYEIFLKTNFYEKRKKTEFFSQLFIFPIKVISKLS